MTRQSLLAQIVRGLVYVALDLLEALMYFAATALLTVALGAVLPLPAALVISLLTASACAGYLWARRMERVRARGEL